MDNTNRSKNRVYGLIIAALVVILIVMVWRASDNEESFGGVRIAVLPLDGEIMGSRNWIKQLNSFAESRRVAAILIPVNSPGGQVAPSQEIYAAIKKVRDETPIPVVVSFGSVAASGGYYAALGADSIFTNPGSLTGSIGVIMQFPNYADLMDKLGVGMKTIKSQDFKDAGSPFRDMSPEELRTFQDIIDDVYDQFITVVEEERGLDRQSMLPLAQGQVFSGRQAYRYGLVDALGTFEDARSAAAEMAGITADTPLLYPPEERQSLWNVVWEDVTSTLPVREPVSSMVLAYRLPY